MKCLLIAILPIIVGLSMRPPAADRDAIVVFAASSLAGVLRELGAAFEQETGIRVQLCLASSGTLARQIAAGAAADLFVSAAPPWIDFLAERDLTVKQTRQEFAVNRLVLIAPAGAVRPRPPVFCVPEFHLAGAFDGRLAMGDPAHVPAGLYADQALQALGWQGQLADRLLPTPDARGALVLVEMGEAGLGIVYATDALTSSRIRVVGVFPEATHAPIAYVKCLVGRPSDPARAFYRFLASRTASHALAKAGFALPSPAPTAATLVSGEPPPSQPGADNGGEG